MNRLTNNKMPLRVLLGGTVHESFIKKWGCILDAHGLEPPKCENFNLTKYILENWIDWYIKTCGNPTNADIDAFYNETKKDPGVSPILLLSVITNLISKGNPTQILPEGTLPLSQNVTTDYTVPEWRMEK